MSVKNVLLIENNAILALATAKVLKNSGYKVEIAFDKAKGLEKIKQKEYDSIILCTQFEGNGEKLHTELLSFNKNLAKKVMFISGDITEFIRFIRLAGNPSLSKRFTNGQLINQLHS